MNFQRLSRIERKLTELEEKIGSDDEPSYIPSGVLAFLSHTFLNARKGRPLLTPLCEQDFLDICEPGNEDRDWEGAARASNRYFDRLLAGDMGVVRPLMTFVKDQNGRTHYGPNPEAIGDPLLLAANWLEEKGIGPQGGFWAAAALAIQNERNGSTNA